jgi:hypothetical protein
MLLTLSVIHNSLNTFLKIFVQNTIKMNPIIFLRGIVKKVADFNNMVNRSPVLRLMAYEILSASWPIFQKHVLPSLMFLQTYGCVYVQKMLSFYFNITVTHDLIKEKLRNQQEQIIPEFLRYY